MSFNVIFMLAQKTKWCQEKLFCRFLPVLGLWGWCQFLLYHTSSPSAREVHVHWVHTYPKNNPTSKVHINPPPPPPKKQDSPPAGNRKRCTARSITCPSLTCPGEGGTTPSCPSWGCTPSCPCWGGGYPSLVLAGGTQTGVPLNGPQKGHGTSGMIIGWDGGEIIPSLGRT